MRRDRCVAWRRAGARRDRCAEHRFHFIARTELGGVSVVVIRPRCLVVAPTVTGYGTA